MGASAGAAAAGGRPPPPSGGIVKITDGGQTWEPLESGTTAWLESVTFSADGATGWVVGRRGTILKTVDGGQTWERRSTDTAADLKSVAFMRNGTTGLAVGSNGTILRTIDGDTWAPSNTDLLSELESVSLTSVAVAGDSDVGWTVGRDGVIVKTVNGGATWSSAPKDYRKLPAPWTWIGFVMGVLAALPARRRLPDPSPASNVADQFLSDRPIRTGEDTLQREPIARALSDVLRNPASEPPLTVAITGDWGQGKSSLMNLVHENLSARNYNAVWFNPGLFV
ncbi:MAG: YCF48-related protein [Chloroflexota bacterium]|nr:YCF48-related protein [Chloroflexota bacterium]